MFGLYHWSGKKGFFFSLKLSYSSCLYFPSARIIGVYHHAHPGSFNIEEYKLTKMVRFLMAMDEAKEKTKFTSIYHGV